ncbi:MAG TPA: hypothetical protein VLI88_04035 [Patescibacteria group bacterium]|nr:hypothetical protein [Patescibacteria group bacterium]
MAFTVATRDPDSPQSVGLVVIGSSLAVAALASLAFVSVATWGTKRGARRGLAVARGLRRGVMVGCVIGLAALLRVVDGLTPLTAAFVVVPFVVAEVVLSTRRA